MRKIVAAIGLAGILAVPAGAVAKPDGTEKHAAVKQCKAERGKSRATRTAFKAKYHSFSRCVRQNAAEEEAENDAARTNAAKDCKAERAADPAAFTEKYGTNRNKKNAFGKCVSGKAQEGKAEMDAQDEQEAEDLKNAAKECAAEKGEIGAGAFAEKYGTNHTRRNALGKCVSGNTRAS